MVLSDKLSNLQLELLKIYNYNVSEEELKDIKKILSRYFANRASDEMDKFWDENNWTNETMEAWLKNGE